VLPLVAGLGLFVVAIASSRSQPLDCAQPDPTGCPLPLDQPVAAMMSGDTLVHRWQIQLPAGGDGTANLWVTLPAPPADYDLYVANGDGAIVGASRQDGPMDEMVQLSGLAPGTYTVVVVSGRCQRTTLPYVVRASSTQSPGLAPVAQPEDAPALPPDLATLLGGGLGNCPAAPSAAGPAVDPYGDPQNRADPYVVPPSGS
jgi:hypothetical protein